MLINISTIIVLIISTIKCLIVKFRCLTLIIFTRCLITTNTKYIISTYDEISTTKIITIMSKSFFISISLIKFIIITFKNEITISLTFSYSLLMSYTIKSIITSSARSNTITGIMNYIINVIK